jgi:orotate phosphoribosyltransferase
MSLFNHGAFTLHSGIASSFLIDCDALTDADLAAIAAQLVRGFAHFGRVEGVPQGGLRLAKAIEPWVNEWSSRLLIVDDVLTSGASMEEQRAGREAQGAVIFARGPCPDWIKPLFRLENLQC